MLDALVKDRDFAQFMKRSLQELIVLFFEKEQNFGILCKVNDVSFSPELPDEMMQDFRELTLFFLAGYTFETARIEDGMLVFEAGFGSENFGSVVSVPLLSIIQVIVEETPIFINLAEEGSKEHLAPQADLDANGVQNSMASFLSNPENAKFLK